MERREQVGCARFRSTHIHPTHRRATTQGKKKAVTYTNLVNKE